MNKFFTVTAGNSLATETVALVNEWAKSRGSLAIADVTIWVPSPRIASTIKEAFIKTSENGTILPNIRSFSVNEEDGEALLFETNNLEEKPPVNNLARTMLLANWVREFRKNISPSQVMESADALGSLFSRLENYGVNFEDLQNIVPEGLSSHWQQNLGFLKIALSYYPKWLEEQNRVDSSKISRTILEEQAEQYKTFGLPSLTLAVGFTDTTPAGLKILQSIASDENGILIFPAIDIDINKTNEPVQPSHPQYTLTNLTNKLNIKKEEISILGKPQTKHGELWHKVFTTNILEKLENPAEYLTNTSIIEATSAQQEAESIALIIRESLETPNKTCALVTTDRDLALRVQAALRRWDINIDDSAGAKLSTTPAGVLSQLVVTCMLNNFTALPIAELIKHPIVSFGIDKAEWKKQAYALENLVLRGELDGRGLHSLKSKLLTIEASKKQELATHAIENIEQTFANIPQGKQNINAWLKIHAEILHKVCGDNNIAFDNDDGEALLKLFTSLQDAGQTAKDVTSNITLKQYIETITALQEKAIVRKRYSTHPRAFIWGPLEARLQPIDRVIIGGTNEGNWPNKTTPDPWLNQQMLESLGLPQAEIFTGLNAHDFMSLASLPEVFITRTVKSDNGDSIPSRFLAMLEVVIGNNAYTNLINNGSIWLNRANKLNQSGNIPKETTHQARPDLAIRPTYWSATTVKTLMQCPYKLYVSKVLSLYKLEDFEKQPDMADKGNIVHNCLQAFFEPLPNFPAPYSGKMNKELIIEHLFKIGEVAFKEIKQPDVKALWWQRYINMAKGFADVLIEHSEEGRKVALTESKAEQQLGSINLHAKADRIDTISNETGQTSIIIDYKTGTPPSNKSVHQGTEPQLLVEAFLANNRKFKEPINRSTPCMVEYWHLKGSEKEPLTIRTPVKHEDMEEALQATEQGLTELNNKYMVNNEAYEAIPGSNSGLKKEKQCTYCDYSSICRFKEWGTNL